MADKLRLYEVKSNAGLNNHLAAQCAGLVTEAILLERDEENFLYIPPQENDSTTTQVNLETLTSHLKGLEKHNLSPIALVRTCAEMDPFHNLPNLELMRKTVFPSGNYRVFVEGVEDSLRDCYPLDSSEYQEALAWPMFQ